MAPRQPHHDTPQKAKVQGAHELFTAKGIPIHPREIFDYFDVPERLRYRIIEEGASTRTRKNQDMNETRRRKSKLSGAKVAETDHLLEEPRLGIEAKVMPWDAIVWSLDLDVSGLTQRR